MNYTENVLVGIKLPMKLDSTFLMVLEWTEGVSNVVQVAGEYCFFVSMTLKSLDQLHFILSQFGEFGDTLTYSIMATPIENKAIDRSQKKRKTKLQ